MSVGQEIESPIIQILKSLRDRLANSTDGVVASYIPELAKANPEWFGISIATLDGKVYEVGTTRQTFTIQSISKPLVYGLALEIHGTERVGKFVGVEPTGDAFNSISLEEGTGRPLNPMINAGAIATSSLVMGSDPEESFSRVLSTISGYAGRPLGIDETVFESERETGHRNRAIGHMLRNYDILTGNPEPALDLYFKQCSIELDCRDLALVGATLANGGINPVTNQRVVKAEFVDKILSVMTTCGMYDFSGEWVYDIGMPAKSGVAGGIVAVLPGQLGIGVFSPPLDALGNSARGVAACRALSQELGLHFLQPPRPSVSTLRSKYTLSNKRSRRRRPKPEIQLLDEFGGRVTVLELQGDLRFSTVECIVREIVDHSESLDYVVLDFKRVLNIDSASVDELFGLASCCTDGGLHLVVTRTRSDQLQQRFDAMLQKGQTISLRFESELDLALEWCEQELLKRYSSTLLSHHIDGTRNRIPLAEHQLCLGMNAQDLAILEQRVEQRSYSPGALIVSRGEPADALFFLMKGDVSVVIDLPAGAIKRLATLCAGMGFGEMSLITGGVRTANIRADNEVECLVLSATVFSSFEEKHPRLSIHLFRNLLRNSNEITARLTAEVASLEA